MLSLAHRYKLCVIALGWCEAGKKRARDDDWLVLWTEAEAQFKQIQLGLLAQLGRSRG